MQDVDFDILHYYIQRGHSIKGLMELTADEKLFYKVSKDLQMEQEQNYISQINGGV